mmetsp:Transcript_9372/g.15285  ORF Transcript_9372/g.15285 Transcript_9372/m.15285 type:complete len:237 (+) Transcript_9372:179-889(+)
MLFNQFASVFILSSCLLLTANAGPFGIKSKGIENDDPATSDNENGNSLVDPSDEEVLDDMEQFALPQMIDMLDGDENDVILATSLMEQFALMAENMSEDEMEILFSEVIDRLGDDNPERVEAVEAVREIIGTLKSFHGSDESAPLMESIAMSPEREIAEATGIAPDMIPESDDWESIHNKRDGILNSLIATGTVSAEDAALYKSDDGAWEKELRLIWDGLKNLAEEGDSVKAKDEL